MHNYANFPLSTLIKKCKYILEQIVARVEAMLLTLGTRVLRTRLALSGPDGSFDAIKVCSHPLMRTIKSLRTKI
jgi:hypothetical protein